MKKETDGEILSIEKVFDSATCNYYYSIGIALDDTPDLKLGKCKIVQ